MDPHERPLAEHLLAEHAEGELARLHRRDRIIARLDELPRPVVPDAHVSRAVVAGRDDTFKRRVVVWMVLRNHREALRAWVVGRPFRDGPRHHDAVELQAHVVVQS